MYLPEPELDMLKQIISSQFTGIKLAYLYGSFAQGTAAENSDVDIAIVFHDHTLPSRLSPLETSMALEIEKHIQREVDLRIINNAPLSFLYQVVNIGQPLFMASDEERINFESYVLSRFFDFRPFWDIHDQYRKDRLERGEFGVKQGKHKITPG